MRQPFFTLGDWTVRPARRVIERGEERVTLEPKLMDVLTTLASRAPDVVSTDELLGACWAGHFYGDNPVHKAIAHLRRSLGDDARTPRYITTIRKRGYRVMVPVTFPDGGPSVDPPRSTTSDPPYPGRRPFDIADAPMFFGRQRSCSDILRRLKGAHAHGYAFLLVVGPPSSGKTSLVCAGVAPAMLAPAGYDGLRATACATVHGIRAAGRPWDALAAAVCEWRIDGEPIFVDSERAALARSLSEDIRLVLGRIAYRLRGPSDVVMLIVDDLDVLLTETADAASVGAFLMAISSMAASGRIAIVGICQDPSLDGRVAGSPALPSGATCDMADPAPGELAQMIRLPARKAGLRFEQESDTEQWLDDALLDHACRMRHPLRVLPAMLRALHDARNEDGLLTFEAYRQACAERAPLDQVLFDNEARHRVRRRTLAVRLHSRWREQLLRSLALLAVSACCLVAVLAAWSVAIET